MVWVGKRGSWSILHLFFISAGIWIDVSYNHSRTIKIQSKVKIIIMMSYTCQLCFSQFNDVIKYLNWSKIHLSCIEWLTSLNSRVFRVLKTNKRKKRQMTKSVVTLANPFSKNLMHNFDLKDCYILRQKLLHFASIVTFAVEITRYFLKTRWISALTKAVTTQQKYHRTKDQTVAKYLNFATFSHLTTHQQIVLT